MEVTQWFDADIKPIKKGVYETKFCEQLVGWSHWNGKAWSCEYPYYESAEKYPLPNGNQNKKWRGLARNPE